jgi:hypothetical protein
LVALPSKFSSPLYSSAHCEGDEQRSRNDIPRMPFVNSCKAYLARGSRIKRFLHDEETFEYQPLGLEIVVFLWLHLEVGGNWEKVLHICIVLVQREMESERSLLASIKPFRGTQFGRHRPM